MYVFCATGNAYSANEEAARFLCALVHHTSCSTVSDSTCGTPVPSTKQPEDYARYVHHSYRYPVLLFASITLVGSH